MITMTIDSKYGAQHGLDCPSIAPIIPPVFSTLFIWKMLTASPDSRPGPANRSADPAPVNFGARAISSQTTQTPWVPHVCSLPNTDIRA